MFAYWIRTFMDGKFIEIEKKSIPFSFTFVIAQRLAFKNWICSQISSLNSKNNRLILFKSSSKIQSMWRDKLRQTNWLIRKMRNSIYKQNIYGTNYMN